MADSLHFRHDIDRKIHIVLDKLNGSPRSSLRTDIPNWLKPDTVDEIEIEVILHTLKDKGLAIEKHELFFITRRGRIYHERGGWGQYVNKQDNDEKRKVEKEEFDFQISKWLLRTKWLPYGLSGAAILISVLSLIVSVQQGKQGGISPEQPQSLKLHKHTPQPIDLDSTKTLPNDSLDKKSSYKK